MAFTLKKINNSPLAKARTEESPRPYFYCTFLGDVPQQLSGSLKVKDAEGNKTEFEVEPGVTIEVDVLGAGKCNAYVVSQKEHEKQDGTMYTITTLSVDKAIYREIRQDKADRATIKLERIMYLATREDVPEEHAELAE